MVFFFINFYSTLNLLIFLHCQLHNRVDDITVVVSQGFDGFCFAAVCLLDDKVDIFIFEAFSVYIGVIDIINIVLDQFRFGGGGSSFSSLSGSSFLLSLFKLFSGLELLVSAQIFNLSLTKNNISITVGVLEDFWFIDGEKPH